MVSSTTAPSKFYFAALTGIRAVAAYMVFFHHFNPFRGSTSQAGKFLEALLEQFHIGVSIFFVLSGFLIAMRYSAGLELSWDWARRYVQNRIARIYPLYFLLTVLSFLIFQLNPAYDVSGLWANPITVSSDKVLQVVLNLTFLRGFFDYFKFSGIGPGWTLTVEECFYLAAPLLLHGLHRSRALLVVYPVLLIGIGYALVAACSALAARGVHTFGLFGTDGFMWSVTFFGRCIEFLLGMSLALLVQQNPLASGRWPLRTIVGLGWIGICLLLMMRVQLPDLPGGAIPAMDRTFYLFTLLRNLLLPIGVTLLLWGLISEQTWLRAVLETNWVGLLGKSSYAFYLVHFGILSYFLRAHITHNELLQFLLSVLVSIALYKLIEHPLQVRLAAKKAKK